MFCDVCRKYRSPALMALTGCLVCWYGWERGWRRFVA